MESETRNCQNCKAHFTIEPEDFIFYAKIKVPPPTFCWRCRLARRLMWRNERALYRRNCDLCKKDIISMYKSDAVFPVYCHECWLSDKWSPLDYGREYDFTAPFFQQFAELQKLVPKPALYVSGNTNSEYCNFTAHMKNCYLVYGSWFSENCGYGQTIMESKECWDCLFIKNCELCFSSIDCTSCNQTHFSQNCSNCFDSAFLYDCKNCSNCFFSYNLRNKNYYVFNKQVSKEEFARIKKETFHSYVALRKSIEGFNEIIQNTALHKFMTGDHNDNVSGEFIYDSKNVKNSYYVYDGENERYAVRGGKQKDAMDVFGVHNGELIYECNNMDFSSMTFFSINGESNFNSDYLVDSTNIKNSFGCISLKNKQYCILNKQYDEATYKKLKQEILSQMKEIPYTDSMSRTYSYGELFPTEIIPFAYNETLAQEYIPLTREAAIESGYMWQSSEDKNYIPSKSYKDLPDTINETDDSILSEIILCEAWDTDKNLAQEHKCSMAFKISRDELLMYKKFGIPLPRQCPNTRNFLISKLRNPIGLWHRPCMCDLPNHQHEGLCPNEFETSYAPDRPEKVFCEKCYQAEVL
jgi:hypothetical protein